MHPPTAKRLTSANKKPLCEINVGWTEAGGLGQAGRRCGRRTYRKVGPPVRGILIPFIQLLSRTFILSMSTAKYNRHGSMPSLIQVYPTAAVDACFNPTKLNVSFCYAAFDTTKPWYKRRKLYARPIVCSVLIRFGEFSVVNSSANQLLND